MEPLWGLANGIGRGVHRTLTFDYVKTMNWIEIFDRKSGVAK